MAQYAILNGNTCENLVVCDPSDADASWVLITDANSEDAGVGSTYDSGTDTFSIAALSYSAEELIEKAKQELIDTDWTQLPDVGLTADNVIQWRTYRSTVRQIKDGDLGLSDWPDLPAKEYV